MTVGTLAGGWEVVAKAPAVAVLAVADGRVLGVEQFRHAIQATTWELPAGLVEPGETPEQAATRELAEEAQLAGDLEFATRFYVSPGFTDEHLTLYSASNLRAAAGTPDAGEDLRVAWRELSGLEADLRAGTLVTSGPTVAGLYYALANLAR